MGRVENKQLIQNMFDELSQGNAEASGQGEPMTNSGKPYNNTYAQVFRIADVKVQAVTEYLDTELDSEVFGK